jgi:bla regulator protein blaR1
MMVWIIETLIATTVLMIAVLAVREPVARRFGAHAAYALWLAPALRMILPPLPADWFGKAIPSFKALGPVTHAITVTSQSQVNGPMIALGLWAVGTALFFGWHMLRYVRFADIAQASAQWLYADGRVEVASSPLISSPVAFGLLWKTVMVPADFTARYDTTEQRLALAHELTHHRRMDLPANMAALAMLSCHWFNPIAHMAYRAFRVDQESACDAQVLCSASAQERHAYGSALFKSATSAAPLAACAMDGAATLKARLVRIGSASSLSKRTPLAIMPLLLAGPLVTASLATAVVAPSKRIVALPAPIAVAEVTSTAVTAKEHQAAAAPKVEAKPDPVAKKAPLELARLVPVSTEPGPAVQVAEGEAANMAPAPALPMMSTLASTCQSAQSQQVFTQQMGDRRVTIITCDDMIQLRTNAKTTEALLQTRTEVEHMDNLTLEQRAVVIQGIDRVLSGLLPLS